MKDNEIDDEIKEVVKFFNSLDGIRTIGSCQGHDDNKIFDSPYITFRCLNERNLGMLVSLFEMAYANEEEVKDWFDEYKEHKPNLIGDWYISIITSNDSECELERDDDSYFLYCLALAECSNNEPSELYKDYDEMLKYWKWKYNKIC